MYFREREKKKNVFVYGCRSEVFNVLKCNRRNNNHNNNATSNNMSGDVKREKWEILLLPTAEKRTIASVSIGRRDGHKRWDFSLIILRVKQKKNPPEPISTMNNKQHYNCEIQFEKRFKQYRKTSCAREYLYFKPTP